LAAQFDPYGRRGRIDRISTRTVSPGVVPRTWIGPVMMCTPGSRAGSGIAAQIAAMPSSISRSGASPAWCVTASIVSVVPGSTSSTAGWAASR
jgi:hypothetical protein